MFRKMICFSSRTRPFLSVIPDQSLFLQEEKQKSSKVLIIHNVCIFVEISNLTFLNRITNQTSPANGIINRL